MGIRTINKYMMIMEIARRIMDLITNIIKEWEAIENNEKEE